ncbi:MAG: GtrA family protein [Bacilli bacterium]
MSLNAKDNSSLKQLVRFILTGVLCALVDFLLCKLVLVFTTNINDIVAIILSTAVGFIGGVILNYILSTYYVFKKGEVKKEKKSAKFIVLFVVFSFIGLVLSVLTMSLSQVIVLKCFNIDISKSSLTDIFNFSFFTDITFWTYFICFCLKTIVGLIWNYFTRKYILYKD